MLIGFYFSLVALGNHIYTTIPEFLLKEHHYLPLLSETERLGISCDAERFPKADLA